MAQLGSQLKRDDGSGSGSRSSNFGGSGSGISGSSSGSGSGCTHRAVVVGDLAQVALGGVLHLQAARGTDCTG